MAFALANLLLGALVALVVGQNARAICLPLGLMDFPDADGGRKLHAKDTPLAGGIALVLTVLATVVLQLPVAGDPQTGRMLLWFLIAVVGLFLVGLLDDRVGLSARIRLAAAAIILLAALSQVPDFAVSFLLFSGQTELLLMPGAGGILFTLLCFVGLLNAVNMADGKNGMVIGQAIVWSLVLLMRAPAVIVPLIAAVLGALLVLFRFNMRGALFLGDGGSYGISAIFGLLAIYSWNNGFDTMRADDMALIFAVPVFDTLRLIVQRLVRGKSPFAPGRDHLHHYLFARWGWPRPLLWILALVALPNFAAVAFPGTGYVWLLVTLGGYCGLLWIATARPKAAV